MSFLGPYTTPAANFWRFGAVLLWFDDLMKALTVLPAASWCLNTKCSMTAFQLKCWNTKCHDTCRCIFHLKPELRVSLFIFLCAPQTPYSPLRLSYNQAAPWLCSLGSLQLNIGSSTICENDFVPFISPSALSASQQRFLPPPSCSSTKQYSYSYNLLLPSWHHCCCNPHPPYPLQELPSDRRVGFTLPGTWV